jgi:hypothetical protein
MSGTSDYFAYREARHKELRKELHVAWEPLAAFIKHIEIEYDGCGDSGCIESITFFDGDGEEVQREDTRAAALRRTLGEYWEVVLPLGWENNDGAFGTIKLDWASQKIDIEHNDRYTDHETSEIHETLEA